MATPTAIQKALKVIYDGTSTSGVQVRVGYDASNYMDVSVSSAGAVTFNATGGSAGFTFSDGIDNTAIGASTASTGAFTTLSASGDVSLTAAAPNIITTAGGGTTTVQMGTSASNSSFVIGNDLGNGLTISPLRSGSSAAGRTTLQSADELRLYGSGGGGIAVATDSGVTIGSPTGGSQGAGTINAEAVYDDGSGPLTDYVFDLAYAGETAHETPDWFRGTLYDVTELATAAQYERRLPWMPTREEYATGRSLGKMLNRLWFGQEQIALYVLDLERRLAALEA